MGMTMIEKIIAAHTNRDKVKPGDIVNARIDFVLGNDVTTPVAVKEFNKIGIDEVFDQDRIAIVPDHFTPNKDIKSAEQCKFIREFARDKGIHNYFEIGEMGIEHCLLPEKGLALPGEIIIGADSHTCTYGALGAFATGVGSTDMAAAMATGYTWFKVPSTIQFVYNGELKPWVSGKDLILYTIGDIGVDGALYRAMEFTGETIENLSMDNRMTISNMAIEAGGKCGLIAPDEKTFKYLENRAQRDYTPCYSDDDAEYEKVIEYDVSDIEPQVAFPHLPENTRPISEEGDIKIDQAVIGSCTNGRMEDLRIAAGILKEKQVHHDVRCIVIPGTQDIYKQALKEGLIEIFIEAGAAVSTPTCGPCLGGHMGILARGEKAIATTNRNFVGRMGHPESEVYLANPAVAAASAIKGYIAHPEEVL
ncbi:3-isopropylmalate dehydratase large subunit [Halothermothrix orenii]|uniref:3-isopropylmalate dehydratase large subunit n=1 Tax=Halothermothrix orenii (strain H 168 / OCM 544 / DSM 9562) TaxID=373903 RepID=LEUC_HALOH|nr:3-isopropylmalate dehydratase large subunit [Halothermothrix orenii]B8CX22.1 RecName: Full=3-isopropylmalate dehydratase large subunit; AltName: Full=Alpha-IPM isomerase; Short=IPMI; AltName: Full=Isopropylmalate isomerase [Halothermothrix orenii H 168]ACL69841.1 3-isopropylmalate dehydratase, large subunit [Halothermothrix orenii H 168]